MLVGHKILQYYCDIGNIANTDILLVRIRYDFISASTGDKGARTRERLHKGRGANSITAHSEKTSAPVSRRLQVPEADAWTT